MLTSLALPEASNVALAAADFPRGEMKLSGAPGGVVLVDGKLGPDDRWLYPVSPFREDERSRPGIDALQFTLTALEGQERFRGIFDEENGSSYARKLLYNPRREGRSSKLSWCWRIPFMATAGQNLIQTESSTLTKSVRSKSGATLPPSTLGFFQTVRWIKLGVTNNETRRDK